MIVNLQILYIKDDLEKKEIAVKLKKPFSATTKSGPLKAFPLERAASTPLQGKYIIFYFSGAHSIVLFNNLKFYIVQKLNLLF